jgi:uncharacterized protein (DUF2164 family)
MGIYNTLVLSIYIPFSKIPKQYLPGYMITSQGIRDASEKIMQKYSSFSHHDLSFDKHLLKIIVCENDYDSMHFGFKTTSDYKVESKYFEYYTQEELPEKSKTITEVNDYITTEQRKDINDFVTEFQLTGSDNIMNFSWNVEYYDTLGD